jgi:hypothetical protein
MECGMSKIVEFMELMEYMEWNKNKIFFNQFIFIYL